MMAGFGLKDVPNALTVGRIALSAATFFLLAAAAETPSAFVRDALLVASFLLFAAGAATDYFDGMLARRWNAASPWGVILDPIADKIAIAAAILGLVVLEPGPAIATPGFLILFREMFVSGLREGLAPLGVKLPVTRLAKWKTTVQLIALALEMIAALLPPGDPLRLSAHALLWLAAALTLWTGWTYGRGAAQALKH
jgi:CDP-diacylglycerol--glycerol-3-phosphate 3-phosphatidyltransferase